MIRKSMILGIAFIVSLFLVSCNIESELFRYKYNAKIEIDNYITIRVQEEYSTTNWELLLSYVDNGKAAIAEAKNKQQVDTALNMAIEEIELLEKFSDNPHASLNLISIELQEQIKQDYLETKIIPLYQSATVTDIKINRYYESHYYQDDTEKEGTFAVVMLRSRFDCYSDNDEKWTDSRGIYLWEYDNLIEMQEASEIGIQMDYSAIRILHQTDLDVEALMQMKEILPNYTSLLKYYGTYNDSVVVIFSTLTMCVPSSEIIEGITFNYTDGNKIRIFYDNAFYSIQEAYDLNYLSLDNLISINNKISN